MGLIKELFGQSPFAALLEHTKKVHECVRLVKPLMEACVRGDHDEIHRLQDQVSRLEYEADKIKHEIREHLPRRYFLPVDHDDLDAFLHSQDDISDAAQDFAVVLLIRRTKIHPQLVPEFTAFVDQILKVVDMMMAAAEQMDALVQSSFGGAEAKAVLAQISGVGEQEWMADRMQRKLSIRVYELEKELDPMTIIFYEKMMRVLSEIANAAENTADMLRMMIVKG